MSCMDTAYGYGSFPPPPPVVPDTASQVRVAHLGSISSPRLVGLPWKSKERPFKKNREKNHQVDDVFLRFGNLNHTKLGTSMLIVGLTSRGYIRDEILSSYIGIGIWCHANAGQQCSSFHEYSGRKSKTQLYWDYFIRFISHYKDPGSLLTNQDFMECHLQVLSTAHVFILSIMERLLPVLHFSPIIMEVENDQFPDQTVF